MNKVEVSLTKEACLVCGNMMDGPIVINKKLTQKAAQAVKDMNGKCIGFADHSCPNCSEHKDDGVYFVSIDASRSLNNNPYRTGKIALVKNEAEIVKNVKDYIISLKDGTRLVFVDENIGSNIGLW